MPSTTRCRRTPVRTWVATFFPALLLAGCFSNPVQQHEVNQDLFAAKLLASAITEDHLSQYSMTVIRTLALEKTWEEYPRTVLPMLRESSKALPEWECAMARAEIAYLFAREAEGAIDESRRWYLEAILEAIAAVRILGEIGSGLDPRQRLLAALYNHGLARFLALTLEAQGHPGTWKSVPGVGGDRELHLVNRERCWDADDFQEYLVADEIGFSGLLNRHRTYGLGVPLIGVRDNTTPTGRERMEYPPRIIAAVTAVLRLQPSGALEINLYDPDRTETLTTADGTVLPLAADRSAPLAYGIATSDLRRLESRGLMKPEELLPLTGIYITQPYDPDKIPLVLVHGLWSSPLAWRDVMNEIRGDTELRKRYQVWCCAYPSGLPILVNAFLLKHSLRDLRAMLDPEGDDPAMQNMVFVGHSMGGLLSKLLVEESGSEIWDLAFRVPPEELKLEPDHREALEEMLYYEPYPFIRRVVFMAVPHRGSSMAEGLIGSVGSSLISLPLELTEALQKIANENRAATYLEEGEELEVSNSIDNLSPDSKVLKVMNEIPFAPGLPYHSIIGDESGEGGGPGTTDGVVPYESSHIEGAVSELVVESDHSVPGNPAALLELRRILRLHLEEL